MKKQPIDISLKNLTPLPKAKGIYLSVEHASNLGDMKTKYKINESRLIHIALQEFFKKYE